MDEFNPIDELYNLEYKDVTISSKVYKKLLISQIMYDNMFQFVGLMDKDGIMIDANRNSRIQNNMSTEDIAGIHFADTAWWRGSEEVKRIIRETSELAAQGKNHRFDIRYYRENVEDETYCDYIVTPLKTSDGKVVFLLPEGRDITEQKQVEKKVIEEKEKAEEASRSKSQFLATMTHDLRTPLNGIKGIVNLLYLDEESDDKRYKLKLLDKSSENLIYIINEILDYSSFEKGRIVVNTSIFNIRSVIKNSLDLMEELFKEKGLYIKYDIPDLWIESDQVLLGQLISNLVGNAIKFTNEGGVEIVVKVINNMVKVRIEDTGIGIKSEDIDKIFDYFYKIDNLRNSKYTGTGLGLAICKRIVNVLDGDIGVKSEYNKGTIFEFDFKTSMVLEEFHEDKDTHIITKLPNIGKIYPLKILVADDNFINRFVFVEFCKSMGLDKVIEVENGQEVLDILEKESFDVIFLDIRMPVLDGVSTLKKIKERYGDNYPITIALTANTLQMDKELYKEEGFHNHLAKPLEMDVLGKMFLDMIDRIK